MLIDAAVVIAFITAMLGLIGLVLRMFIAGELLSKNVVRREAYERQTALVDSYAVKFAEQTQAVRLLAESVATLTNTVEQLQTTVERRRTPRA